MHMLNKCLAKCKTHAKKLAYESVIRPNIEYASVIWNPHTSNNINKLEKVNKLGKKFVNKNNDGIIYNPDDAILRRFKNDLKFFHKIHHQHVEVGVNESYINDNTNNNLRNNNSYKMQIANHDGYKHSFFNRTIHMWSNINQQYKQITDPTIFKDGLYDGSMNVINSYHAYIRRLGISSLISAADLSATTYTYH